MKAYMLQCMSTLVVFTFGLAVNCSSTAWEEALYGSAAGVVGCILVPVLIAKFGEQYDNRK